MSKLTIYRAVTDAQREQILDRVARHNQLWGDANDIITDVDFLVAEVHPTFDIDSNSYDAVDFCRGLIDLFLEWGL